MGLLPRNKEIVDKENAINGYNKSVLEKTMTLISEELNNFSTSEVSSIRKCISNVINSADCVNKGKINRIIIALDKDITPRFVRCFYDNTKLLISTSCKIDFTMQHLFHEFKFSSRESSNKYYIKGSEVYFVVINIKNGEPVYSGTGRVK